MKGSKVWQFYDRIDATSVKCRVCLRPIKTYNNTTNMIAHLKCKHKDQAASVLPCWSKTDKRIMKLEKNSLDPESDQQEDNDEPTSMLQNAVEINDIDMGELGEEVLNKVEDVPQYEIKILPKTPPKKTMVRKYNKYNPPLPMVTNPRTATTYGKQIVNGHDSDNAGREDRFDVIGKSIAYKLRDLPMEVALVTEKLLNDILYEAWVGHINKRSAINIYDIDAAGDIALH